MLKTTHRRVMNADDRANIALLQQTVEALVKKMNAAVKKKSSLIKQVHPDQKISAVNLIQYLALRSEDIRQLQDNLHIIGLSSLTSGESHIMRQLQEVLLRMGKAIPAAEISPCDFYKGDELIEARSAQLFGTKKEADIPFLMVTFDVKFLDNYKLVKKLLQAGMNVARINAAHDDEATWKKMIDLVHTASRETGIPCKIYMDIAGPKMRTSILGPDPSKQKVHVQEGQEIILAEKDAAYNPSGIVIGCDEKGIVNQLMPGERVLFDDGVIEGKILSNKDGLAVLKILRISGKKDKIKARKGINFPGANLTLSSLTAYDLSVLPFMCEHADLIGYSFVREATDVQQLQQELSKYSRRPGIILKIETPASVKNFPSLLMQGMKDAVVGVMIARGDLAVEIGFERLSEVQEEILWISEAAHVPVIWATQVLETLNKSGMATRSEVTDAFFAAQAECVMVNKGDYLLSVINSLTDILRRSGGHHLKKRYTFRPMSIASNYLTRKKMS